MIINANQSESFLELTDQSQEVNKGGSLYDPVLSSLDWVKAVRVVVENPRGSGCCRGKLHVWWLRYLYFFLLLLVFALLIRAAPAQEDNPSDADFVDTEVHSVTTGYREH